MDPTLTGIGRDRWRIPVLAYHGLHAPDKDYASTDHVALEEDLKLIRRLGFKVARLADFAALIWDARLCPLDSGPWLEQGAFA